MKTLVTTFRSQRALVMVCSGGGGHGRDLRPARDPNSLGEAGAAAQQRAVRTDGSARRNDRAQRHPSAGQLRRAVIAEHGRQDAQK